MSRFVVSDLNCIYIYYIMPTYTNRSLSDVRFGFTCPFCSTSYKSTSGVTTHAKQCDDNPEPDEDLDDVIVWGETSASNMIHWQSEISKLVKELIRSNELAVMQTQTPEQIREFIRQRMKNRTMNEYNEESDIYRIYEFFFGLTETDIHTRGNAFCIRMKKYLKGDA